MSENEPTKVAIACQGGGSHTAFTAGVLKGLLREWDDEYELVGISGTSGGAFNALAAWYGLVTADEDRAIELLDAIWEDLSASSVSDRFVNDFVVGLSRLGSMGVPMLQVSPYDIPGSEVGKDEIRETLVPPDLGGFDHVLLYLADADPFPDWDGLEQAEFFNREVMGRSTDEIFQVRKDATDFHWERFGIDFPYPETEEDLFTPVDSQGDIDATFAPSMLNPGRGYTAYVVSGKGMPNTHSDRMTNTDTHSTGKVRDGSWGATLNEATELGGTYGATGESHVPAGTSVTFGDYSIRMGDNEDPIEIRFLSEHPIVAGGRAPSAFNCDLLHDEWGEGQVHGTLGGTMGNGLRNVLTFPPSLDG